jgi:hypothetical protein
MSRLPIVVVATAVIAASPASAGKAPREVKAIDAQCDAALKLDDAFRVKPRIVCDVSDATRPKAGDGSGKWITFKDDAELKKYSDENGVPNTRARVWSAPDGTTVASMYFQSDTGDWSQAVEYCFRADGTLARTWATVSNLVEDVSGRRIAYYAPSGGVVFATVKATDSAGGRLDDPERLEHPIVYPTVPSLPFNAPAGAAPPRRKPASAAEQSPSVDGELDPATVAVFVRSQLGAMRACYKAALADDRTLAGKVVMHWTIDLAGIPRGVTVESNTMRASTVPKCLRGTIESWRFAKPAGGSVDVSFPFVFQPADVVEPAKSSPAAPAKFP